jgi:hypothetical protein
LTATPTGGTPPYELIFSNGTIINGAVGATSITVTPTARKTSFSVVAIDANGCQSDPSNIVNVCVTGSCLSKAIKAKYCGC